MGTNTDFTGAIRITPAVDPLLAQRINEFLDIRHMRRNVAQLQRQYQSAEERAERSLLHDGNFGEDGAFFLPVLTKDLSVDLKDGGVEGLTDWMSVNTPPGSCPSLYSNLVLVTDPYGAHSYLGWNGAEKTYGMTDWIRLLASILVPQWYHMDGEIFAVEECGMRFYRITVRDAAIHEYELDMRATYQEEFEEAWETQVEKEEGSCNE